MALNMRAVLTLLLAAAFAAPLAAAASVIDFFMEQEGLPVDRSRGPGSIRLDGMGRLSLVIEDENNEINLADYGGNRAGVIFDKDRWSIESWARFSDRTSEPDDATKNEFEFGTVGTEVIWRVADERAIGGSLAWRRLRGDEEPGDNYEVRGPAGSIFYNEKLFSWLAAAVTLVNRSENEDRVSDDVFGLRHKQGRLEGQLAAALTRGDLRIGLTWDFQRGQIDGKSRDPAAFHTDLFNWQRPVDTYGLQAVFKPSSRIEGAAFFQSQSIEGGEKAEISWSDRFPDNGSQENFYLETTSFVEEEDRTTFGTRWLLRLQDRWRVGASITGLDGSSLVREGVNFKGSRRSVDAEFDWLSFGGGIGGTFFDRRLQAGVEGFLVRGTRTDIGVSERTWQDRRAHAGLEFFWTQNFVVRGGVVGQDQDLDVDRPASRQRGFIYTFGASYLPRGGLWQLDGAVNFDRRDRAVEGDTGKVLEELSWGLALRRLL